MKSSLLSLTLLITIASFAQPMYMTRNGQISFYSKTPMENIDAVNNEVTAMINSSTGELAFAVLIKSFRFERALMEEHFNENYMESDKFPKATFSGKITNPGNVNFNANGNYPVSVEGELTIHGVKKSITSTGTINISGSKVTALSTFLVRLADYNISIPALVADKISETVEVKVNCEYQPKK